MWNEEKILPSLEIHWFKIHHWQYRHHSKSSTLFRWQVLFANAEVISKGFFFPPSVPQNSSVPLKQRIRKIMKNSLKLPPLFFNPLCSYWEFHIEFIRMSNVWGWNVSMLKSNIFLIALQPPLLNTLVSMLQKLCWMVYVANRLNSNLWLYYFLTSGLTLSDPLYLF